MEFGYVVVLQISVEKKLMEIDKYNLTENSQTYN